MPSYVELFAGAGGGILAHSILDGLDLIAAAEQAPFPRAVLATRMAEGIMPSCDIHEDVAGMKGKPFRGVDILSGGFPCQGLSLAGGKLWLDDPRSALIWQMLRVAHESQARMIFAENSPNLRSKGLHLIIPELQRMGYGRIAWCKLGADDLGAFHQRKRLWVLALRGGPSGTSALGDPRKIPACGIVQGARMSPLKLTDIFPASLNRRQYTLPTLIASDARRSGNRPGDGLWSLSDRLGVTKKCAKTKQMPTLAATDWKSPYSSKGLLDQIAKRSKPLRDMLPAYAGGYVINPDWAEWYMGWPVGWTNISEPLTRTRCKRWAQLVERDAWWTREIEMTALPATLLARTETTSHEKRIKALGNGQVPLVASHALAGLRLVLQGS